MPCHRMLRALALRATSRSLTRGQTILAFARPRFPFVLSVLRREILFFHFTETGGTGLGGALRRSRFRDGNCLCSHREGRVWVLGLGGR